MTNDNCPRCKSIKVIEGRLAAGDSHPHFVPVDTKHFQLSFDNPYMRFEEKSFVCLDCGLLWTTTDKSTAIAKLRSWANDSLAEKLRAWGVMPREP